MSSSDRSLVDVEDVRAGVDAVLADHVAALGREIGSIGDDDQLVQAVSSMLAGGKRMRAAFCYWSWRAHAGAGAGDQPEQGSPRGPATGDAATGDRAHRDEVLRVGAALELFQAAALFHDDVMDDSDTRRGKPAAHRRFAELHAAHRWSGASDRFGESAAILLGDLALIASEREFALAVDRLDARARSRARAVFDTMRTEVTVGQYLDVRAQALPWGTDATEDERRARAVIRAKSARYSVEHPLTLGAALAGADDDALQHCRAVGLPLGEAFQLRDDLLGVFGDPSTTGKPAGDDLREGKRTVLVARALQQATDDDRTTVLSGLGRRDLAPEEVAAIRASLMRSGAVESVERLIDELTAGALDTLAGAPLDEPGRSMLVELGRAAAVRRA